MRWTVAVALALGVVTTVGARQNSPQPMTPGAISGVVVDALTGQPVGDAVVGLSTGQFSQPKRQQTDARGRFVYPEVSGGQTYVLTASRIGYLGSNDLPPSLTRATARVPLAPGQWARDVRIALYPPASISGTVMDALGDPIVGAYVRVLMKVDIAGRARLAAGAIATTDDLGRYRISGLTKGTYLVAVVSVSETSPRDMSQGALNNLPAGRAASLPERPPAIGTSSSADAAVRLLVGRHNTDGDSRSAYSALYFSGATNATSATPVEVDFGDERRATDFRLQRVPAWRVSGTVLAPAGELPALSLRLIPAGSEGLGTGGETATARPAADGRFSFLAVPSGRYTLLASSGSGEFSIQSAFISRTRLPAMGTIIGGQVGATSDRVTFGQTAADVSASWGRRTVVVDDHDLDGVEVNVTRGASISGQIVLENGSELPANRTAAVVVEPSLENDWLMAPAFTVTENSGNAPSWSAPRAFAIRGLTPGRYYVKTNGTSVTIKSMLWNGRDLANDTIDVSDGSDLTGVTLTVTTRVATLAGVVHDANGAAARTAAVICFPVDPGAWQKFGFNPARIRSAGAETNGTFRIEGLPAGDYLVVAVPVTQRDAWHDVRFLEAASRVAARVHLDWGATVSQTLKIEVVGAR